MENEEKVIKALKRLSASISNILETWDHVSDPAIFYSKDKEIELWNSLEDLLLVIPFPKR